MGISDADRGCDRDTEPSQIGGRGNECRGLLTQLLLPVSGDRAQDDADALLGEFGSLSAVLAAPPEALARTLGGERGCADFLRTVRSVLVHALRREAGDGPLLPSSAALIDYLHLRLAHACDEEFRVLYLNSRNVLLKDETVATGTPNEVSIHPRMIVKRALELGATALILVHNHPSGSPDPSQGDIQTTARIVRAAKTLDIVVHDHIIIARSGSRSFRQSGLLV